MKERGTVEEPLARDRAVALWRQIAARVRAEIGAGGFGRARRLPGEHALARRFGVNRHTVRQALRALAEEGLVRAERGRGTFVADVIVDYRLGEHTRFGANLLAQERVPTREILGVESGQRDPATAVRLGLDPRARLVRVRTRGLADEVPILIGETWLEERRFPGVAALLADRPSFTELYRSHGIAEYRRRATRVLAALPSAEEAALLRQAVTRPVLVTEALDVDGDGRPLSWARAVWAGARVHLTVDAP